MEICCTDQATMTAPIAVVNITSYWSKQNADGTYNIWIDGKTEDAAFVVSKEDYETNYEMVWELSELINTDALLTFSHAFELAQDKDLRFKRYGSEELWGVACNDGEKALGRFDANGKLISYGYPAFKDMFAADWILVQLSERTQPVQNGDKSELDLVECGTE